jgi:hypothetical protein
VRVLPEVRIERAARPTTDLWKRVPVAPRNGALVGFSFRPFQAEEFGLDANETLRELLAMPFDVVRLGAYWSRLGRGTDRPCFAELDDHVAAVEAAGKRLVLCVGAVKCFGYPEMFVPSHRMEVPFPEGRLIEPGTHPQLLEAALEFIGQVVERYRLCEAVVAWQVEHEAVDPLGIEHSWRLSERWVRHEVDAVRALDPDRPVVLNGFLATSRPVRAQQWWRTRDQGDSLAVAERLADIVGLDVYPRHALANVGGVGCYLDGSRTGWAQRHRRRLFQRAERAGVPLMITEGQAEPWEAVTIPPNVGGRVMASCTPEQVIENYDQCMGWPVPLWAYLFWGAEYWALRRRSGDRRYVEAVERILAEG